jgi:hypothetical protein
MATTVDHSNMNQKNGKNHPHTAPAQHHATPPAVAAPPVAVAATDDDDEGEEIAAPVPERKATREEKRALFDTYFKENAAVAAVVAAANASIEAAKAKQAAHVKVMYETIGKGPFIVDGVRLTVMARKKKKSSEETYLIRKKVESEAESI